MTCLLKLPILLAILTFCGLLVSPQSVLGAEEGGPPLVTRWAKDVSQTPWPEYPRPQLVREKWQNLNGDWDLSITDLSASKPTSYPGTILVPFPIESHLGGLQKSLAPSEFAWYHREFTVDANWQGQRLLLHFGAVDWHAEVWINDVRVGEHRGGYDPFTFDVTQHVDFEHVNEIVIRVSDPTDSGTQPRGKQVLKPEGIWYTPTSGIWQTVWLEPVPNSYIKDLQVESNPNKSSLSVTVVADEAPTEAVARIEIESDGRTFASTEAQVGEAATLNLGNAHLWSPDDPFLYDITVKLVVDGQVVDEISSYFGMRSIELGKDQNGQMRMLLNGRPLFQFGPLDQGYWPDGLYTAPTEEAMRYDLEVTKRLGFNMIRKHVKVEPARWYYWCDKMGLLVWQDMPSGGPSPPWPSDGLESQRESDSSDQYLAELQAMVDGLRHFSCVVVWVPFNEAWGQFETESVTNWLKEYDPSRLVISASGGNDFGCGDIKDDHFYPGPGAPPAEKSRAAVLGEFGGFGLPLAGHTWQDEKNWGYRSFRSADQLTAAYTDAIANLRPLVESHLSAAVYTQVTDVEVEVNGLMTYDRAVIKPDEAAIESANVQLYEPLPKATEEQKVNASVLAWWRFEEGDTGDSVSDLSNQMGAIAARDFSGHNNHLFAFSANNAPKIGDHVPQRSFGLIKPANKLCLDDTSSPASDALSRDLFTNPDVSRTHMDKLERYSFSDWTVEASFCLTDHAADQVALSKEEDIGGVFHPLFQLGVFGEPPVIGVELLDHAGNTSVIRSDVKVDLKKWYHTVITCEDGSVRLYVARDDDASDFALVGQAQIANSLARRGGTWLVGRGCELGTIGRDFLGWIDEVRISTKALKESQFLFGNNSEVKE